MAAPSSVAKAFDHVLALEGKTVLYVEKLHLFRVVTSDVRPRDDGQGFQIAATYVPTHGMSCRRERWHFGAGWEYFTASRDTVSSTYGGWTLYTSTAVMDELLSILEPLAPGRSYLSDHTWTPVDGNSMVTAKGTPGPVMRDVRSFLAKL